MKLLFVSTRLTARAAAGWLAIILLLANSLAAQAAPVRNAGLTNLDNRIRLEPSVAGTDLRQNALAHLRQQVPGVNVSTDALLDTPKFVRARSGFLTGANGQGLSVSAQTAAAIPANDPYRSVKAFLNEHAGLFGHDATALEDATISRDSATAHNGLRTVVWQQQLDGLPVFDSVLIGNITAAGELVSVAGGFLPDAALLADTGTPNRAALQVQPTVSAAAAISAAAQNLGDSLAQNEVVSSGGAVIGAGYAQFQARQSSAYARQVWLPLNRGNLRLCWEVIVRSQDTREMYQILVDAETSTVPVRRSLTHHISDATYNVYTSDSPSPFSPGHQTPSAAQPPLVSRTLVTTSALNVNASPNGWINDGDNETRGNNAETFLDRNFDQQPDGALPQGNPTRVFDFALDLTQDPLSYSNAATVQLFYLINKYHDLVYQLGFTESAGNFQENNFGRGGLGGDRVIGYVQAGADLGIADNASFGTPPDGFNGEMNMFVWDFPNPQRDGSLDAEIVFHEATHGTSTRLVGGGVLISALQTRGMGEGWSDFYATSLLSEPNDDPDAAYGPGGYATFQLGGLTENYYFGIRRYPYCTDMTKNPLTFKDIDPNQIIPHSGVPRNPISPFFPQEASETHNQGEVWCVTLWEVRANLFHKYGPGANQLMLQLITDAMKLSPANPTFIEARDAIVLADQVNNGGANSIDIWKGFAKRGMGFSASAPPNTTTTGVVEAYDLPGLQIATMLVGGGNGNGAIDYNECNDLFVVLTNLTVSGISNVQVTLSTTTPGVSFGARNSPYLDMPAGGGGTNLVAFKMSTTPFFVCGTPIELSVLIKSDQLTSPTTFTLDSGATGAPKRFDSTAPVVINDADPVGTNSFITVSNLISAVRQVTVSLYLTHTFDSDLYFALSGPDGTTILLSDHNGGSGNNYGASCDPELFRTTFDDNAATSISAGVPPFVGSFQPQEPLSVFLGKSGTNVNGRWKLHVVDDVGFDVGTVQCWSLHIATAVCTDGGGTCPGADLAIGMVDSPDPVFIGSNLVYTISVTNNGPSAATNVVVNQALPPSVVFSSGGASQGSVTHAGGTVVANVGILSVTGVATITVNVIPTLAAVISSTASVASSDVDPNTANNAVSLTTQVNPPASDLAVGVFDSPDPVLLGELLTYNVSVTNNGPTTASGVTVTNTLPLGVVVQSAGPSQGFATINGNVVVFSFGTLTNAGRATGTINVIPTAEGTLIATAVARANQVDPLPANNSVAASTTVGPAANLAVTFSDAPDPVVVRSNWTYSITVTNQGPSTASGVVVNQTLPAGVNVVSRSTTLGTTSVAGNAVVANLGTLVNGVGAVVTVTVNASNTGSYASTVTATASQADPDLSNNVAATITTVALPFVSIVTGGSTLTAESVPADGAVSVGETVTVQFRLRNAGNVATTNLTATLLATGGVTSPSPAGPVTYGVLSPSGVPVGRPFTFTASGTNGGTVTATLQLQDGGNNLSNVTFSFKLPTVHTFANTNGIIIPDNGIASPYPSTIAVSGLDGLVGKVTATLSNLNHTFPQDVDVLLVAPNGQQTILMSAAGAAFLSAADVTFDDGAAFPIPQNESILPGAYRPASYGPGSDLPFPATAGPYFTAMSVFNGLNANGQWSLFVVDRFTGDAGSITGGWRLGFTIITPVNHIVDLGVAASVSPTPSFVAVNQSFVFTITNTGPDAATGVSFTNFVPVSATLISASASQGSVTTNANSVTGSLGTINVGASATVTLIVKPNAVGALALTGTVAASETDLNPANNSGTATMTASAQVADLVVKAVANTNSIVLGSNVTFTISVTNVGPQQALGAYVADAFPAGLDFISTSAAGFVNGAGEFIVPLGDFAAGGSYTYTIVANASGVGTLTNLVYGSTTSSDTNAANNVSPVVIVSSAPAPIIVPNAAVLTVESISPPNATVDVGETVTVSLALKNVGSANTTNLVATLLATGGVTGPSAAQDYGALAQGGAAVSRSYTFTASGVNGGVVVATLQLVDGVKSLGTATFSFSLPAITSYSNATAISIAAQGSASPYPSSITVSGSTGLVTRATVTLNGLTHRFPDDVDIQLVGPTGQKVMLMSDAGGGNAITNRTLTFDDTGDILPDSSTIFSGTFAPADYEPGDVFPAPSPAGPVAVSLAAFNGAGANGTWSLFVADDSTGDGGSIAGGWTLTLTTVNAVNPLTDLRVSMVGTPASLYVGSALTYSVGVTNNGPAAATDVTITDVLPSGLNFVSATSSQGSLTNVDGVVTINFGSLAVAGSATATIRVVPGIGGVVSNVVAVAGGESDANPVNNTAHTTTTVIIPVRANLTDVMVTNAQLQFTLTGDPGMAYVIQASTNLTAWTSLATNTAPTPSGIIKFIDTTNPGFNSRFYRAIRVIP